jgi:hypothetical protein
VLKAKIPLRLFLLHEAHGLGLPQDSSCCVQLSKLYHLQDNLVNATQSSEHKIFNADIKQMMLRRSKTAKSMSIFDVPPLIWEKIKSL